jgi:hypothetical protein
VERFGERLLILGPVGGEPPASPEEPTSNLAEWRHRKGVEAKVIGKTLKPLPPLPPWPCPVEESGQPRGRVAEALHAHQQWNKYMEADVLTHDDMRCAADCTKKEHDAVLEMSEAEYDEYVRKRDTG